MPTLQPRAVFLGELDTVDTTQLPWIVRGDENLMAFDPEQAAIIWQYTVPFESIYTAREVLSFGDLVISSYTPHDDSGGWLYALNRQTGEVQWSRAVPNGSLQGHNKSRYVLHSDGHRIVLNDRDHELALVIDPTTGETLFSRPYGIYFDEIKVCGHFVVASGRTDNTYRLMRMDLNDENATATVLKDDAIIGKFIPYDGNVLTMSLLRDRSASILQEIDPTSGSVLWSLKLPKQGPHAILQLMGDHQCIISAENTGTTLIDLTSQTVLWHKEEKQFDPVYTDAGIVCSSKVKGISGAEYLMLRHSSDGSVLATEQQWKYFWKRGGRGKHVLARLQRVPKELDPGLDIVDSGNCTALLSLTDKTDPPFFCPAPTKKVLLEEMGSYTPPRSTVLKEDLKSALIRFKADRSWRVLTRTLKQIFGVEKVHKEVKAYFEYLVENGPPEGPCGLNTLDGMADLSFTYDQLFGYGSNEELVAMLHLGRIVDRELHLGLHSGKIWIIHHDNYAEFAYQHEEALEANPLDVLKGPIAKASPLTWSEFLHFQQNVEGLDDEALRTMEEEEPEQFLEVVKKGFGWSWKVLQKRLYGTSLDVLTYQTSETYDLLSTYVEQEKNKQ